jgi:hypothetical protein
VTAAVALGLLVTWTGLGLIGAATWVLEVRDRYGDRARVLADGVLAPRRRRSYRLSSRRFVINAWAQLTFFLWCLLAAAGAWLHLTPATATDGQGIWLVIVQTGLVLVELLMTLNGVEARINRRQGAFDPALGHAR